MNTHLGSCVQDRDACSDNAVGVNEVLRPPGADGTAWGDKTNGPEEEIGVRDITLRDTQQKQKER